MALKNLPNNCLPFQPQMPKVTYAENLFTYVNRKKLKKKFNESDVIQT